MHWKERYGGVYFSLPAINLTGPEWAVYLRDRNIEISETAHDLLFDPNFKPTTNSVGDIVLFRKSQFFGNEDKIDIKKLFSIKKNSLIKPPQELGCIMLRIFSLNEIKEMIPVDEKGKRKIGSNLNFSIIIMNPIEDREGDMMVFYISCNQGKVSLKAITNTNYSLSSLSGEITFAFQVPN